MKSVEQTYQQGDGKYVSDYDLTTMLLQLYPEITTRRLLLVGHSQGTFYTNELYNYLIGHGFPAADIAVYNIGTPADYVAGGGNYLTSANDQLIKRVRVLAERFRAPGPLLPNIVLPLFPGEESNPYGGHSISGDYLANAPDRIVADIDRALSKLQTQFVGQGTGDCFTPPKNTLAYQIQEVSFAVADPITKVAYSGVQISGGLLQTQLQLELAVAQKAYQGLAGLGGTAVSALSNLGERISAATNLLMQLSANHLSATTALAPDIFSGSPPPSVPPPSIETYEPSDPHSVVEVSAAASLPPPPVVQSPEIGVPAQIVVATSAASSVSPVSVATSSLILEPQTAPQPFMPSSLVPVIIVPGFGGGGAPPPLAQSEAPAAPELAEATSTPDATSTLMSISLAILSPSTGESFSANTILFSGTTTPNVLVTAEYGGQSFDTAADAAGDWSLELTLLEGTTTVAFEALDSSSNASTTAAITVGVFLPPSPPPPSGLDAGWFCAPDTETMVDENSSISYEPGSGDCTYVSNFLADGISRTLVLYRGILGNASAVDEHHTTLALYEASNDAIPADAADGEPFFIAIWKIATSTDDENFESYFSTGSSTPPHNDYKVLPFSFGTPIPSEPPILD